MPVHVALVAIFVVLFVAGQISSEFRRQAASEIVATARSGATPGWLEQLDRIS
jgi:hypothetical protein